MELLGGKGGGSGKKELLGGKGGGSGKKDGFVRITETWEGEVAGVTGSPVSISR